MEMNLDRAEIERLKDALHEDKTNLAAAIAEMVRLAEARSWILDGRGSYEWDDERYRREAGHALREVIAYGKKALQDSGNLAHGEDGCRPKRWVPIAELEKWKQRAGAAEAVLAQRRESGQDTAAR